MTEREPLAVWLYGTQVAVLRDAGDDSIAVEWTGPAVERWGVNSRIVSNLLPISRPPSAPHPRRVKVFVDGLLPEGHGRTNYALEAGLRPDDSFGLLTRYGRDTAGALVFQPLAEPEPAHVGQYVDLDADELGRRLREAIRHVPAQTLGRGRDSSTLAGMQPKITVHRTASGQWQACLDGAPSTWIVKVAHPRESPAADVVDTEVLSLDLARAAGLAAAHAEIHTFGGVRAIAVRRYDRVETKDGIRRIHQEDLAQAIGLNTAEPLRKFQRGNRMPSLAQAAEVLRAGGSEPDDLLRLVTVNYLLGNSDAHAKNVSFLRHADGTASLAPAYDIAMHLHHADEQHRTALDINCKVNYADIGAEDLLAEGRSWGLPSKRVAGLVSGTVEALRAALHSADTAGHPGVSDEALEVVRKRAARTARELAPVTQQPSQPQPARRGPSRRRPRDPTRP